MDLVEQIVRDLVVECGGVEKADVTKVKSMIEKKIVEIEKVERRRTLIILKQHGLLPDYGEPLEEIERKLDEAQEEMMCIEYEMNPDVPKCKMLCPFCERV